MAVDVILGTGRIDMVGLLLRTLSCGYRGVVSAREAPSGVSVHNLLVPLTSLVGRVGDLDRLGELLGRFRMVTVTGPGGSGKTRVAIETARSLSGRFEDGAWLVELAAVEDPAAVSSAVAAVLGVREQPGQSLTESLCDVISGRHLLIVLDNCEHLIEGVARLCETMLSAAPDVRILGTSREPLRIEGEARYPLAPLSVPTDGEDRLVAESEAVTLFIERARQVDPGFELTDLRAPVVARIVRRLDGMPLAIELAAVHVGALGVDQLEDGLQDRFRFLVSGSRTAPRRQQSLASAIDWSYQLLTDDQQQLLGRLSVFPAPFTLTAAQAIGGPAAVDITPALVDRSMLVAPREGSDGRSRFGMLESLRVYAAAKLVISGQAEETVVGMAAWALESAERAAARFDTTPAEERDAVLWFEAEYDNLRFALDWFLDHDPLAAIRLAVSIAPWWNRRGRATEGRAPLERALAACIQPPPSLAASAHRWLAVLLRRTSDKRSALAHATDAVDLLEPTGPSPLLVDALVCQSVLLRNLNDLDRADRLGRQALDIAQALGYATGLSEACAAIGFAALYAGDFVTAHNWALKAGDVDATLVTPIAHRNRNCLLAVSRQETGDIRGAETACRNGLALARAAGDVEMESWYLGMSAESYGASGRLVEACAYLGEAIDFATRIGDRMGLWQNLAHVVERFTPPARLEDAAVLLGASRALMEAIGDTNNMPLGHQQLAHIEHNLAALAPATRRRAELRGAALTIDAAVELARSLLAHATADATTPAQHELSKRELELVTLVAEGLTDDQIGHKLYISINTVHSHLDRIRDKTGCRRRVDLTRFAVDTGLV